MINESVYRVAYDHGGQIGDYTYKLYVYIDYATKFNCHQNIVVVAD